MDAHYEFPTTIKIEYQISLKRLQFKNKWFIDFSRPQPPEKCKDHGETMSCRTKLSLVGSLLFNNMHTKGDTLIGTPLVHMIFIQGVGTCWSS